MKFKVGDTLIYTSDSSTRRELTIVEISGDRYWYIGGFHGSIILADQNCIKVNYRKSKLGKILYAKSN